MFVEHHVTAVCKAGLYHLRNISRIRRYISRHTAEILMLLLSPVWIFVTHYFQGGKGEGGRSRIMSLVSLKSGITYVF